MAVSSRATRLSDSLDELVDAVGVTLLFVMLIAGFWIGDMMGWS